MATNVNDGECRDLCELNSVRGFRLGDESKTIGLHTLSVKKLFVRGQYELGVGSISCYSVEYEGWIYGLGVCMKSLSLWSNEHHLVSFPCINTQQHRSYQSIKTLLHLWKQLSHFRLKITG